MYNTKTSVWVGNLGKYNEGELVGEWISLPFTEEDFEKLLKRIGIGEEDEFGQPYEEWYIADWESLMPIHITQYMGYNALMELSELIERIEDMYESEVKAIMAYLDESSNNLEEAVDCIEDGRFVHLPWIHSWEEYGEYIFDNYGYGSSVPESMRDFIDFEKLGEYKGDGTISKEHGYFESY